MKHLLLFASILIGLISCIDCGPQQELSVRIDFYSDSLQIDSVFAVHALDQAIFQKQVTQNTFGLPEFIFPISLIADSTTYIFLSGARTDTLTLFYEREFRYKGDCGFIVNAHKPMSGPQVRTTFKGAKVNYETYVTSGRVKPFLEPEAPGISVKITL